ncbi:Arginyl-tRNA synthetase [Escherichia coli]|nr:Arginyl-tRNA synthetase [Escherichia coli]CAD5882187.1 Arginyl-tRNA synthetase [Escherichia coli]CAD6095090.1 Arginyl-tRNA synthetase [Escherichia coli]
MIMIINCIDIRFLPPSHRTGDHVGAVRVLFTRQNPVCIVSDYSRTLAQRSFPVGLRSLLMREYGDNTTH